MEHKIGLARPDQQIHSEQEFFGFQATYIRNTLDSINLYRVPVSREIQRRDPTEFAGSKILAITGMSDIPIAIAAGSTSEQSIIPIVIAPTREGSGLLTDSSTGAIYTDSFWICEDGKFKYVKPTQPLSIDMLNVMFDKDRNDPSLSLVFEINNRLHDIADDKAKTRQILIDNGIRVPRGFVMIPGDTMNDFESLVDSTLASKGLVTKGLFGAHGDEVLMWDTDDFAELASYVWSGINEWENPIIVEERIIAPDIPQLREHLGLGNDTIVDYNFRVLVTLDREDPSAIDAEIRFKEHNKYPVNITSQDEPAEAIRLDGVISEEMRKQIYLVAEQATKAFYSEALGNGENVVGFAGIDLMIDGSGNVYVLEVNAGGPVGGLGTLSSLDCEPLTTTVQNMLAQLEESNQLYQLPKGMLDESKLRRVSHNLIDLHNLYDMYVFSEKYQHALDMVTAFAPLDEDYDTVIDCFTSLSVETGDFLPAYIYLKKLTDGKREGYYTKALERLSNLFHKYSHPDYDNQYGKESADYA